MPLFTAKNAEKRRGKGLDFSLGVIGRQEGTGFKVEMPHPVDYDIAFSWLVVEQKD